MCTCDDLILYIDLFNNNMIMFFDKMGDRVDDCAESLSNIINNLYEDDITINKNSTKNKNKNIGYSRLEQIVILGKDEVIFDRNNMNPKIKMKIETKPIDIESDIESDNGSWDIL